MCFNLKLNPMKPNIFTHDHNFSYRDLLTFKEFLAANANAEETSEQILKENSQKSRKQKYKKYDCYPKPTKEN